MNFKNDVIFAAVFVFVLAAASCASSKVSSSDGSNQVGDTAMVEATFGMISAGSSQAEGDGAIVDEYVAVSQNSASTSPVQAAQAVPAVSGKSSSDSLKANQKIDPYTGWVYVPEKNFSVTNGDVKITLRGDTGSFGIYVIPETGRPIPVLSTYDLFCASFFSLRIGKKEYRLNRENGVVSEARRTPYGGQMAYTIKGQAQVVVDFSFMPSIATSSRVDMLRVSVYTTNLSRSTQSFTVKSVFDTVLGENAFTHFATAAHSRIDTEKQYLEMGSEKWIRSYNEKAAVQFLLNGKGITVPQAVSLSNKDQISLPNWIPLVQEERSFSSVLSYNNSALGINWNPVYLDPLKSDIITFYVSFAADGNEPAGRDFLTSLEEGRSALSANLPESAPITNVAPLPQGVSPQELSTAYREGMPVIPGAENASPVEVNSTAHIPGVSSSEDWDEPIQVYENGKPVSEQVQSGNQENASAEGLSQPSQSQGSAGKISSDYQLTPAYIQSLMDRIQFIEANPQSASQSELDALNSELDEILGKLRSMN